MDIGTHLLVGYSLARAGPGRISPAVTPAMVTAAAAPNLEVVHFLLGTRSYLSHAGTWGHSLAGAAVLGLLAGIPFWWWGKRKGKAVPLIKLALACLVAALSHVLLDWTTSSSIQWFFPFRRGQYHLDWLPQTDFLLLLVLLGGILLPALFRLINEEIGSGRRYAGRRWGAWLALTGCALLVGGRGLLHGNALREFQGRQLRGGAALREAAFATAVNPFRWRAVAETNNTVEAAEVLLLGPQAGINYLDSRFKPSPHPALDAAQATDTARVFLRRARFPLAEVIRDGSDWRVDLEDLRFPEDSRAGTRLSARFLVDSSNRVLREELRWGRFRSEIESRRQSSATQTDDASPEFLPTNRSMRYPTRISAAASKDTCKRFWSM